MMYLHNSENKKYKILISIVFIISFVGIQATLIINNIIRENKAMAEIEDNDITINNTIIEEYDFIDNTVYWVEKGEVYHYYENCKSLQRSFNIYRGTIRQSGKSRACEVCY